MQGPGDSGISEEEYRIYYIREEKSTRDPGSIAEAGEGGRIRRGSPASVVVCRRGVWHDYVLVLAGVGDA